jgi:outer membrane lipoprotein-sorting protein
LKRIVALVLVLVVVLGCVSVAACGGGGEGGATTAPPTDGVTTPAGGGNGAPAGEDLEEILGLGAGIVSVKYDMLVTAPGTPTMTMHMWVKHNKIRTEMTEQGQTTIMLIDYDAGTYYMYMPDQNMAMQMPFDQAAESAIEEAQSITNYDYDIVGTETMDGKVCLVVTYTVGNESAKMWVWKEHGFPIRIETTTAEGTTVVEFKNIDFSNIPDSMFELPPGVEVMEF